MSLDDPFATPPAADDPFADPPPADPAAEVAAQPVEATTATPVETPNPDLPVVDREGAPVEGDAAFNPLTQKMEGDAPAPVEQPVPPAASPEAPAPQEPPVQAPPSAPQQDPAAVPDQPTPAPTEDSPSEPQEVRETTVEDMGGGEAPPQPDAATEAANEAKVAAQPTPPVEEVAPPVEGQTEQVPPAPAPVEPEQDDSQQDEQSGPRGLGKSPVRHYKVLYQTAAAQWTEVNLQTAKDANTSASPNIVTVKDEEDASDQGELWLAARNNDHAVRLSWIILGTPQSGVTTMPVPKGAWKPKRIAPAPPEPSRERLVIS